MDPDVLFSHLFSSSTLHLLIFFIHDSRFSSVFVSLVINGIMNTDVTDFANTDTLRRWNENRSFKLQLKISFRGLRGEGK
jgi:hypothetical protein